MRSIEFVVEMKTFSYKAYDSQAVRIDGEIEANDLQSARLALSRKGLMIASLQEKKGAELGTKLFSRTSISSDELEFFTSELSLLLNSGVTIDRGLSVLKRNSTSAPQAKMVAEIYDSVRRGDSLATAMESQGEIFNPLYVNLVQLGESTGTLPSVFLRLSEDIKFQSELKRKIIQSLTYPAAIFFVCVLCVTFIFNYIVPQMSGLFEGISEVPRYTQILLGMSDWMINYQWLLLLTILASAVGVAFAIRTPRGAQRLDDLMLRLPILRGLSILTERIRFNTAVALMLESGVMIDKCLEMAVGSIRNNALRHDLHVAKERVKKGETLSKTLGASPLFPDFSLSLIEVGEESGNLAPVFIEISGRSRREFHHSIDRMTSLLEPILILTMGGIVGGVVVTMLLSIVSVNDIGI